MRVAIAGGTGLLGRRLTAALAVGGHAVTVLTRDAAWHPAVSLADRSGEAIIAAPWTPDGTVGPWAQALEGVDVVVNLAGTSIGNGRWTPETKERILESRLLSTRSIVEAARQMDRRLSLLLNASAVGYYGLCDDRVLTETSPPGRGFLAEVCIRSEAEALQAESAGIRVLLLRSGVVLDLDGGALPQIMRPFKIFAGGPVGTGRQYSSWIHHADWLRLVTWLLASPLSGAVNATAPEPVTNSAFADALGRAMHRPSRFATPAFVLRLALGEMADELLLGGQRVVPARALAEGFQFTFSGIDVALGDLVGARGR